MKLAYWNRKNTRNLNEKQSDHINVSLSIYNDPLVNIDIENVKENNQNNQVQENKSGSTGAFNLLLTYGPF